MAQEKPTLETWLQENNVDASFLNLGVPMPDSESAAQELGLDARSIFKSLVLMTEKKACFVAVLPGHKRLDLKCLRKIVGARKVRFAPRDLAEETTGFPTGGTPPFGHKMPIPVFVDQSLFDCEKAYCGGGQPETLIHIQPDELVRLAQATVTHICLPEDDHD